MRIRPHYSQLSREQRLTFVQALLALKEDGRYDEHVRIHQRATCWARRGPAFLPWHRHLLLRFEEDLRTVEPEVTLPYWDFTRDRSLQSSLWDEDFMGGDGRPHDGMVITGPFATEAGAWPLANGGFLVRRLGQDPAARDLPSVADLQHALDDAVYDVAPWDHAVPSGFRGRIEGWVRGPALHNRVHAWVGGVMARDDAPDDPLLWLVLAFVDKLWSDWQRLHPGAEYLPVQGGPPGHNREDTLWPWNGGDRPEVVAPFGESPAKVRPCDLLDHRALGYVYDTDPEAGGGVFTTLAVGEEQPTFAFGEEVPAAGAGATAGRGEPARPHDRVGAPRDGGTGRGRWPGDPTTLMVGEEQPPVTTRMRGEEDLPTTLAVGEEDPPATTLAVGEEDPPVTTQVAGEESPHPTTQALGEEGPLPTTQVVGEEGPTTLAWGEEGRFGAPRPTTRAAGEEQYPESMSMEAQPMRMAQAGGQGRPHFTTLAWGEEGPRPTTLAWGEEGSQPTTLAVGEEGPQLTTLAVGEEQPQPTTLAMGEEGPQLTTLAVGEEEPQPTTLAVGEEGSQPTTLAMGEEGPQLTTLAVGEEEPQPTTLAVGEEEPQPTTLAVGEEQPQPTTLAVGEEQSLTTLAVGEEGPPPPTDSAAQAPSTTATEGEHDVPLTTAMVGEETEPPTTEAQGEEEGSAGPSGGTGPFGAF